MVFGRRRRTNKRLKNLLVLLSTFLFFAARLIPTRDLTRTSTLNYARSAKPSPKNEFLSFIRPNKCIRKCSNKENLLPKDSKLGTCSFVSGKFNKTWNASSSEDFLSCQEAIHNLNGDVREFLVRAKDFANKLWIEEKGIVFSCKISQIKQVYATIRIIREFFNSNLPIEVFVSKKDLPGCLKVLTPFNTVCRVPKFGSIIEAPKSRFGWKVVSILQSSFKHILWLDTDCFPVVNPSELFENANFKKSGAIFWPDLTGDKCDPNEVSIWPSGSSEGALWNVFNLRFNADNWKHVQEFESGQMLIDSVLYSRALHLAYFLTENDKEAFRWSWLTLNLDYYFSQYPALASYHMQFDQASKQCYRIHYLQGKPVFLHGKKKSRSFLKCGYEVSTTKRLNIASIERGIKKCTRGICYNQTSFFCDDETFFYIDITEPIGTAVQAVEDSWENKYSQWKEL